MLQDVFKGLRVVDCGSYIAAPAAATILADLGAEVIKLEPPGVGDPQRLSSTRKGNPVADHDYAWTLLSRNKKSVAIDLRSTDSREVLRRLIARTDVFVTNYPLQVRERLGISYPELSPLNPRLVYASFTGYGERGPDRDRPGFDSTAYWARSGLMGMVKPGAEADPSRSLPGMGDFPSAISLFSCIAVGLYNRERTGQGSYMSTSLVANGVWANSHMIQAALCGGSVPSRATRAEWPNAANNHYRCRDGSWLVLALLNEDKQWPLLVRCLEKPELLEDPRFETTDSRRSRSTELIKILDGCFAGKDRSEWKEILDRAGVVCGIIAEMSDLRVDQHMVEGEVFIPSADGPFMTVNNPIALNNDKTIKMGTAPKLGEHSEEILSDLGFKADEIVQLKRNKIVA